jgi:hypothetical protein
VEFLKSADLLPADAPTYARREEADANMQSFIGWVQWESRQWAGVRSEY